MKSAADKIKAGLRDAIAFARAAQVDQAEHGGSMTNRIPLQFRLLSDAALAGGRWTALADEDAQGIEARSDETPQAVECEASQSGHRPKGVA